MDKHITSYAQLNFRRYQVPSDSISWSVDFDVYSPVCYESDKHINGDERTSKR